MTVIVKDLQSDKIKVLTKGADSVVNELLSEIDDQSAESVQQSQIRYTTMQNMLQHARDGLRTLLLAEKTLSSQDYQIWSEKLRQAESTQGKGRSRKIEKVYSLIENNLEVIGSTAVQDNLQDQVPETIAKFKEAGINFWVLTGDKEETAINIGFASGMLSNETQRLYITSGNSSKLMSQIRDCKMWQE